MDNTSIRTAHPIYEDVLALLTAAGFVSLGIFLFHQVGLLTGGTAGLALLLQKVTGISFGLLFFGINLPFYALAWLRMGPRFTFNTFVSVAAVSYMTDHLNGVLQIGKIEPLYAALIGGTLIGMGLLIMFRHKSSLGGSTFWRSLFRIALASGRASCRWGSIAPLLLPRFSWCSPGSWRSPSWRQLSVIWC